MTRSCRDGRLGPSRHRKEVRCGRRGGDRKSRRARGSGGGARPRAGGRGAAAQLEAILNLSRYHREHEKFYARAPLERAIELQRAARTLTTLADRWSEAVPGQAPPTGARFAGCEDLNEPAAIQADGVLFMEGEGEPVELARLKRDLGVIADDYAGTGAWLAEAMEASWEAAAPAAPSGPRRPAGGAPPDHRQRLAGGRPERAGRPARAPRGRPARAARPLAGGGPRRPRRPAASARLPALGLGAPRPRGGPRGRVGGTRPADPVPGSRSRERPPRAAT